MELELEARSPSGPVYRLGRRPNPWQLVPWSLAHSDGTFGNRFDDPEGLYRVLYASSQRLSCFLETLAPFRPDMSLMAEFALIEGPDDFLPFGTLPYDWLEKRLMGRAAIQGQFADIYAPHWVGYLRTSLAGEALRLGMKDIDLSTLFVAEPRRLTQLASRKAYGLKFAGIFYQSRYGSSLENWALFEPISLDHIDVETLTEGDPDLLHALQIHGIKLQPNPYAR